MRLWMASVLLWTCVAGLAQEAVAPGGAAAAPAAKPDPVAEARARMDQKDWAGARAIWEAFLSGTPNYGYGHLQLGHCRYELADYMQAEISFMNAIQQLGMENQGAFLPAAHLGLLRTRLMRNPCEGMETCDAPAAKTALCAYARDEFKLSLQDVTAAEREPLMKAWQEACDCAGTPERRWEPLVNLLSMATDLPLTCRMVVQTIHKAAGPDEVLRVAGLMPSKKLSPEVAAEFAKALVDYGRFTPEPRAFEAALALGNTALAAAPKNPVAMGAVALALQSLEHPDEAAALWEQVVAIDAGNSANWINLARCYAAAPGGFGKAADALERGLKNVTDEEGIKKLRKEAGNLYEREGVNPCRVPNLQKAKAHYDQAGMPEDVARVNKWIEICTTNPPDVRDDPKPPPVDPCKKAAYDCYMTTDPAACAYFEKNCK